MLSTLRLTLTAAALLLSTRTAVAEHKPACAENASRAQCDCQDGRCDRSDAADLCLPDDRCDPPYNALIDSAEGKERTALFAGIAGVVAIGGGVTLMLLDRGGTSAGAERSVTVRVRPSAQGLVASLVGRF